MEEGTRAEEFIKEADMNIPNRLVHTIERSGFRADIYETSRPISR